jgi:predicted nucleic acid-binding protein
MNMAGSVLVDTNVVVAYFRGDKVLHPRFAGLTPVYVP